MFNLVCYINCTELLGVEFYVDMAKKRCYSEDYIKFAFDVLADGGVSKTQCAII